MCVLMCCSESTYRALPCTRPERRSQAPAAARLSAPAVCRAAGRPAAGRCSPCVCGATDRPAADTPAHRAAALGPADAARHTSESSSAHNRTVHQAELYLRVLLLLIAWLPRRQALSSRCCRSRASSCCRSSKRCTSSAAASRAL